MRTSRLALALILLAPTLAAESWTLSTVDAGSDVGRYASIATHYGKTHIAYYDVRGGNLKYAVTGDDQQWKTEIVDSVGNVGEHASIFVDSKGTPHISYYDATNSDLKYAKKLAGTWKINVVDSANAGWYSSIAVRSDHLVYISYLSMAGWNLKVVKGVPGNWVTALTDWTNVVGLGTSVTISPKGCANVSYTDYTASSLKYAHDCDGSFQVFTLDPVNVLIPTAIAVDSLGVLHIAYLSGGLRYATNASGDFVLEGVDSSIGLEEADVSIAVSEDGRPHITYHDPITNELKLARKEQGTWTKTVIDKGGTYNAIALDEAGRIRIAYFDSDPADLRYAINF